MKCPKCGSDHVDRDEVDIGVGIQYGPYGCFECGWTEGNYENPTETEEWNEENPQGRLNTPQEPSED